VVLLALDKRSHTLRKNRGDDWNEKFPSHVVAEWMGHSPEVAHKHYLRVYDRNVEAATATSIDDKLAQKPENKRIDKEGQNHIDLLKKKIRAIMRA